MRWRGGPISGLLRSKSPGIFGRQAKLVQTHRSQGLRRHPMRSIANVLRVKPMNRREGVALTAERAADRSAHRARSVPSELRAFAEPYLLPGESYRDFAKSGRKAAWNGCGRWISSNPPGRSQSNRSLKSLNRHLRSGCRASRDHIKTPRCDLTNISSRPAGS